MRNLTAGVFSVFNAGTGHRIDEHNNTIGELYRQCDDPEDMKHPNDGPQGGLGTLFGTGMQKLCDETVRKILDAAPYIVNLVGHSRGGVLCHMITNALAEKNWNGEINIVVLDPVHRSAAHATEFRKLKPKRYVCMIMENVSGLAGRAFQLYQPESLGSDMTALGMPGTHGSGTQFVTSAIGRVCFVIAHRFLRHCGTSFQGDPFSDRDLAELFAQVLHENPPTFNSSGLVQSRKIADYSGPKRDAKVGRSAEFAAASRTGALVDLRNTPYIINHVHASCLRNAFPGIYARFTGVLGNQRDVDRELDDIEANLPYLFQSFKKLGMV